MSLPEQRVERRLAAILAADVAGYSRLMGEDEEGTLGALKSHRAELIDPAVARHRGRIVKTTGDGALVEFASAVDAVHCAVAVQEGMAERNATMQEGKRIAFRIGINVGDVIFDAGDIYGDGVNVAARLEALAEPGGVLVSGTAYDQVKGKLPFAFEDLGAREVKNIADPVRVYKVALAGAAPAGAEAAALSILVLPFTTLGGDGSQDFWGDVLTEEITTYLSRIPESFVIARSTAFTFKGKPVDVKRVGKELGVRYVLEGSVQPGGSRVRVNAQLIDADTGAHLWAERFDAAHGDLLDMQDEIVTRIARTLQVRLSAVEAARLARVKPGNPDAELLALRAESLFLAHGVSESPETRQYMQLCEDALARDPRNLRALAILALTLAIRINFGLEDRTRAARAADLSERALAIDLDHYLARHARGALLMVQHKAEEALVEEERVLELNPGYIGSYIMLCACYAAVGRPEEGLRQIEKALRLSPRDPLLWALYQRKGLLHLMLRQDDQAIEVLRRSIALNPEIMMLSSSYLAAALALTDRIDEARDYLARYLKNAPLRTITAWRAQVGAAHPAYLAFRERLYEGLRKAGMPEA